MLPHPVRSPPLCAPATTSGSFFFSFFSFFNNLLAARRFNWSHFCQTRQAATHLGIIQGAPADTGTRPPPPPAPPHWFWWASRKSPNFLWTLSPPLPGLIGSPSQLGIKGLMSVRFSQPRFHTQKKTWCASPSCCPAHLPSSSFGSVKQERRHYRNPSFSPVVFSIMGSWSARMWEPRVGLSLVCTGQSCHSESSLGDGSSKSNKVHDVKCTWVKNNRYFLHFYFYLDWKLTKLSPQNRDPLK